MYVILHQNVKSSHEYTVKYYSQYYNCEHELPIETECEFNKMHVI